MAGVKSFGLIQEVKRYIFIFFIFSIPLLSEATIPLVLTDDVQEVCLCREFVGYFEDSSGSVTLSEVLKPDFEKLFQESRAADLMNENTSSAYWLKFDINSQTDKPFRIELFDYDLDEVSLFIPDEKGVYRQHRAGFTLPFNERELNHKNISFRLDIPEGTTSDIYMRLKSRRHNVLEPIVRSYDRFLNYGFTEYLYFGLFYGLMLLMIFYNFLYFILLRKSHFLYYVISGTGFLLYIAAENGTGFQFLWPNYPQFNTLAASIGLFVGITAMLLFAYRFLHLGRKGSAIIKNIFIAAVLARTLIFGVQLYYPDFYRWEILDILFIQLVLIAGIIRYRYKPAKWYIVAFCLLDIAFLITGMERIDFLPSSIFTVYAFNGGIILQFIFLSIGIGESIQETYRLKNLADAKLIQEYKKNDELKEKVNRELEKLVKDRTLVLEEQNVEIQKQKEEIREMYERLEELVKKRTFQLEERNSIIQKYSFSNSHLVRAPLARILGLTNLARIEKKASLELIEMIQMNAKELDEVVRQMNRILDEDE